MIALPTRQKAPAGRAELRKRTPVEHRLARIGQSQGDTARYRGEPVARGHTTGGFPGASSRSASTSADAAVGTPRVMLRYSGG
jgi:hypothetical protein